MTHFRKFANKDRRMQLLLQIPQKSEQTGRAELGAAAEQSIKTKRPDKKAKDLIGRVRIYVIISR